VEVVVAAPAAAPAEPEEVLAAADAEVGSEEAARVMG
jgi:hypothetical protein